MNNIFTYFIERDIVMTMHILLLIKQIELYTLTYCFLVLHLFIATDIEICCYSPMYIIQMYKNEIHKKMYARPDH